MFIAGVVCLCLAVLVAGSGVWTLTRPAGADLTTQVLRAVAPTQLAAGVMLAAGGIGALAAPPSIALMVLILCVIGAIGTVAAGSWQGARYAARREAASASSGCAGSCTSCIRSCE
jgi:TRAP-type mannitol/chloroaromatic compound transport system permease large subunit